MLNDLLKLDRVFNCCFERKGDVRCFGERDRPSGERSVVPPEKREKNHYIYRKLNYC